MTTDVEYQQAYLTALARSIGTQRAEKRLRDEDLETEFARLIAPLPMPDPSGQAYIKRKGLPEAVLTIVRDQSGIAGAIAALEAEPVLALDIESTGFDPHSQRWLLLQIASPTQVFVFDAVALELSALSPLFERDILWLGHNIKFDLKWIAKATLNPRRVFDTYLAHRLLTAGTGVQSNLKAVAAQYLGVSLDKEVRNEFVGLDKKPGGILQRHLAPDLIAYAVKDVLALFPIYLWEREGIRKHKLEVVASIEMGCVKAVADIELRGIRIDTTLWRSLLAREADRAAIEKRKLLDMLPNGQIERVSFLDEVADAPVINVDSQSELIKLFRKMNVIIPDTAEPTLKRCPHPAAKQVLAYRKHHKVDEMFGEELLAKINKKTGRLHADFMQYGADTGRFSSQNPNVQQIPANGDNGDFRKGFVAAPGYKLVTCDYSQIELRILAELTQDAVMTAIFNQGKTDLHIMTAAKMFGFDYAEGYRLIKKIDAVAEGRAAWESDDEKTLAKKYKALRAPAKNISFGLVYGMGAQGLANRVEIAIDPNDPRLATLGEDGIKAEEAQKLIDAYFGVYTDVQTWLNRTAKEGVRLGYSRTKAGRMRWYTLPDRRSQEWRQAQSRTERRSKNSPIQGLNSDITKLALAILRPALVGYDAYIVNTVHDEITVEARSDQAEAVAGLMVYWMKRAGEAFIKSVPIVVEYGIESYWKK